MTSAAGSTGRQKTRVIAYIDGFNLYYGLKNACRTADAESHRHGTDGTFGRSLYWLDIHALIQKYLRSSDECVAIKYFSAPRRIPKLVKISDEEHAEMEASNRRQGALLDALSMLPLVEVVLGWYSEKSPLRCSCGQERAMWEEKQTDVNIATHMMRDAYLNKLDVAIVMSADSDLVSPVSAVQEIGKRVRVLLPPGRKRADQLRTVATECHNVKLRMLRGLVMPESIAREGKPPLCCPSEWKPTTGWVWGEPAPS